MNSLNDRNCFILFYFTSLSLVLHTRNPCDNLLQVITYFCSGIQTVASCIYHLKFLSVHLICSSDIFELIYPIYDSFFHSKKTPSVTFKTNNLRSKNQGFLVTTAFMIPSYSANSLNLFLS